MSELVFFENDLDEAPDLNGFRGTFDKCQQRAK